MKLSVAGAEEAREAYAYTGGKAFDAGVNIDDGKPRVIVETNGPKGVQTVVFDAESGQIIGGHAGGEPD